jgi:hypothetical protein
MLYNCGSSESRSFQEQLAVSEELFEKLDKNKDNQIDYFEFFTLMLEDDRPTWLLKAAAMNDW